MSNPAILLPKSGVSVRRRLGRSRAAVPWPRGERSRARSRSMVEGVVEPTFVALPRRVRRRIAPVDLGVPVAQPAAQTGVLVLGRRFTKDFGIRFAPIRHNWTYSVSPTALNEMIVMTGGNFLKTIEHFAGIVSLNKTYAQSTDIEVLKRRYLDDWLPALDKGLTTLSIRGTALFLVQLFALGYHFGFSPGFLYYVLLSLIHI